MRLLHGVALSSVLALGAAAVADTYYVPDDFPTIQAAIDFASMERDEILVRPGVYEEAIDFKGKAIWLRSTDGRDVTTIDASTLPRPVSVVKCVNGESPDTILDGFTITGGTGTWWEWEGIDYLDGGGMFNVGSCPTIRNCAFVGNQVPDAGGGLFASGGHLTVEGTTFQGNDANSGGGMLVTYCVATVEGSLFLENTAINGGGLHAWDEATLDVRECTFLDNVCDRGGAMTAVASSTVRITDSRFAGNAAATIGGAMRICESNDIWIEDTTFEMNQAHDGGAISVYGAAPVMIRCNFWDNIAEGKGGGIYVKTGPGPDITNASFIGNTAFCGGALALKPGSEPILTGVLFAENVADYGGAMFMDDGHPLLTNVTFTENAANVTGGGMFGQHGSLARVRNSILWGNFGLEVVNVDTSWTTVDFSAVQGGWGGKGNIDADPRFVDAAAGDYRLKTDSGCIDAGANNALPSDTHDIDNDMNTAERLPLDLDGKWRFADAMKRDTGCGEPVIVDMGAYEFHGVPVHPVLMGDVDGSGDVDFLDLVEVLSTWGECVPDCCLADVDFSGEIDFNDLLMVTANWS